MNVTFERRLRQVSVRNRLGKANLRMDLRNKLNSTASTDARSIIRRRVGQKNVPVRDARNLLRPKKQIKKNRMVPFILPTRTVENEQFLRTQTNNRKNARAVQPQNMIRQPNVSNFLNFGLPVPSLDFLQRATPSNGLFTNVLPFGDIETTVQNTMGSKISPIQGYRLEVRNLQPSVTLDDMFELFSSIGTLRLCTITRPGQADIVFNHAGDALEAVSRYNGRELDGRPMSVTLTTPVSKVSTNEVDSVTGMFSRLGPSHGRNQTDTRINKMLLTSKSHVTNPPSSEVDADVVRKALFNVTSSSSGGQTRRPVDFSVSLR